MAGKCCDDATPARRGDAIVVLGCRVGAAGSAPAALMRRLDRAIRLFERGAAPKLVVSGGAFGPISEADFMHRLLDLKYSSNIVDVDYAGEGFDGGAGLRADLEAAGQRDLDFAGREVEYHRDAAAAAGLAGDHAL